MSRNISSGGLHGAPVAPPEERDASVPQNISSGVLYAHVPPERLDALGKELAEKASAARGPTRLLLPTDAPAVLRQSIRQWIYPPKLLEEVPHRLNDPLFADAVLACLARMLTTPPGILPSSTVHERRIDSTGREC